MDRLSVAALLGGHEAAFPVFSYIPHAIREDLVIVVHNVIALLLAARDDANEVDEGRALKALYALPTLAFRQQLDANEAARTRIQLCLLGRWETVGTPSG
ncbi:hypothetical protein KFE25_001362 [Diacronema lutheri]|uniref:Uncharacterized protein n=1 Tax=Diacronema lutheri TaxID=2081491 RepID=A0A8J5XCG5_DIALT|nr:hypothetical protein KFE25_001362 [Diacronema lutheri]